MPKPAAGGGKIKLVRQGQTASGKYGTDPNPVDTLPKNVRDLKP